MKVPEADEQAFAEVVRQLRTPDGFLRILPMIGFEHGLWKRQEDIFRSVFDYQQTYVRTGHSTGKTFVAGAIGVAFLIANPQTKVIYIATKLEQVKRQAWSEFMRVYGALRTFLLSGRPIVATLPEPAAESVNIAQDWYATIWAGQAADPEAFRGFHAPHLLIVIDEASGTSDAVRQAVDGCLTSPDNRLLAISNPTRTSGWFYEHQQKGSKHRNCITVSSFECADLGIPGLATRDWIERVREDYGEDSPYWQFGVLGQFPQETEDSLIPWGAIQAAIDRWEATPEDPGRRAVGADIARQGQDATVIAHLAGDRVVEMRAFHGRDQVSVTGEIKMLCVANGLRRFGIDASAPGWGPMDVLRREGYEVAEFVSGASPSDKARFANLKAEAAWSLRERFIAGNIAIPPVQELIRDLSGWKYEFISGSKLRVIDPPKSPDYGDALLIAHWTQTASSVPAVMIGAA